MTEMRFKRKDNINTSLYKLCTCF